MARAWDKAGLFALAYVLPRTRMAGDRRSPLRSATRFRALAWELPVWGVRAATRPPLRIGEAAQRNASL